MSDFLTIALPPLLLVIFAVAASYFYQRLESRLSRSVLSTPRSEGVAPSQASGSISHQHRIQVFGLYVDAFAAGARPSVGMSHPGKAWHGLLAAQLLEGRFSLRRATALTAHVKVRGEWQADYWQSVGEAAGDMAPIADRKTEQFHMFTESADATRIHRFIGGSIRDIYAPKSLA